MASPEIIRSGVTTFKDWEESFRFAISTNNAGKMDILLEGTKSRKRWCTGYMAMDEYVTDRNNIATAGVEGYGELFRKILQTLDDSNDDDSDGSNDDDSDDSDDSEDSDVDYDSNLLGKTERTLSTLENGALQLDLSINFTLVVNGSLVINYKFQLESVSLERLRALEAKLRALEVKLRALEEDSSKDSVEAAEESDGEMVNVDSGLVR